MSTPTTLGNLYQTRTSTTLTLGDLSLVNAAQDPFDNIIVNNGQGLQAVLFGDNASGKRPIYVPLLFQTSLPAGLSSLQLEIADNGESLIFYGNDRRLVAGSFSPKELNDVPLNALATSAEITVAQCPIIIATGLPAGANAYIDLTRANPRIEALEFGYSKNHIEKLFEFLNARGIVLISQLTQMTLEQYQVIFDRNIHKALDLQGALVKMGLSFSSEIVQAKKFKEYGAPVLS